MNLFAIMGYSAIYTINPESYPADIRNLGVGNANSAAKVASISCPIFTGWILSQNHGFQIGITSFACLFAITGLFALFLKETRQESTKTSLIQNS